MTQRSLRGLVAVALLIGGLPIEVAESTERRLALGPPREFGRVIAGASGMLTYRDGQPRHLSGEIVLTGLRPHHRYVLTLNCKREIGCRDTGLPERYHSEEYFDFQEVRSDARGLVREIVDIPLPPRTYSVKFLVKDREADGWPVVLFNDFFTFVVR